MHRHINTLVHTWIHVLRHKHANPCTKRQTDKRNCLLLKASPAAFGWTPTCVLRSSQHLWLGPHVRVCVYVCVYVCVCVCVYSQNNLRSHSFKTHQLPSLEFKPYDVRSILALPLLAHVSPLWDFMAPGVPTSVRVCVCALWSSVIMIVWVCVCVNWKQPGEWAQCFHKTNKKVTNAQHRAHHSTAGLVLVERQNKMYSAVSVTWWSI